MSKPLELKIYPPVPEMPCKSDMGYAYEDWFDDRSYERRLTQKKRLTDAEVAAEYWHARDDADCRRHRVDMGGENGVGLSADEAEDFERVVHRFAMLPHSDEVAA